MRNLVAWILICMLCLAGAVAEGAAQSEGEAAAGAGWPEGRSAAQPYAHVPEVDLNKTLGYIMLYPRTQMPATRFCDVLEIYLPREDVRLGEGSLTLCDANGEVEKVSFADRSCVELRTLESKELEGLMWGSGLCVEVHLPISLRLDEKYYVLMDAGCLSAADGKLQSQEMTRVKSKPIEEQAWTPLVTGDFGVSGLYYADAPAGDEEDEAEAPEAGEGAAVELRTEPKEGDQIAFDLVLGGDAKSAVIYTGNDSAYFDPIEYTESGRVTGTVTGADLQWGIVFLNENGEVLDVLQLK